MKRDSWLAIAITERTVSPYTVYSAVNAATSKCRYEGRVGDSGDSLRMGLGAIGGTGIGDNMYQHEITS